MAEILPPPRVPTEKELAEHPDDQKHYSHPDFWAIYRVRPKMEPGKKWKGKHVETCAFTRADNAWWIDVEFRR